MKYWTHWISLRCKQLNIYYKHLLKFITLLAKSYELAEPKKKKKETPSKKTVSKIN